MGRVTILETFEKDKTQKKLLDELMRFAHTIKGSSAAMEGAGGQNRTVGLHFTKVLLYH